MKIRAEVLREKSPQLNHKFFQYLLGFALVSYWVTVLDASSPLARQFLSS
jgi:hypothetical protein